MQTLRKLPKTSPKRKAETVKNQMSAVEEIRITVRVACDYPLIFKTQQISRDLVEIFRGRREQVPPVDLVAVRDPHLRSLRLPVITGLFAHTHQEAGSSECSFAFPFEQ